MNHSTLKSLVWTCSGIGGALGIAWLGAAAPYLGTSLSPSGLVAYVAIGAAVVIGVGSVMSFPFPNRGAKVFGLLVAVAVIIAVLLIQLATACSFGNCL